MSHMILVLKSSSRVNKSHLCIYICLIHNQCKPRSEDAVSGYDHKIIHIVHRAIQNQSKISNLTPSTCDWPFL